MVHVPLGGRRGGREGEVELVEVGEEVLLLRSSSLVGAEPPVDNAGA